MTVDAAIQAKSQKELARFASSSWEKFRGNFCPYIRPESQKDPPCLITCIGYVSWQIPMLRVSAWIFGLVHAGYSKALQLCLSVWSSAKSHSFIQLQSENTKTKEYERFRSSNKKTTAPLRSIFDPCWLFWRISFANFSRTYKAQIFFPRCVTRALLFS